MSVFERSEAFLSSRGLVFYGPLFQANPLHQSKVDEIITFRTEQNLTRASHLESERQKRIEATLALDARSVHFAAELNGQIQASVRLTPAPFELGLLLPELDLTPYRQYFEFSRLCTGIESPRKARIAQALVIRAGHWLFTSTSAEGIVALCKQDNVAYMTRFGLHKIRTELSVKGRDGAYTLMGNDKESIKAKILSELSRYERKGVQYESGYA